MEKTGRYQFMAEPFHCDCNGRLFMGHMGNHLLNAADFHSNDRGFGMRYLMSIGRSWVLSRLAIEMDEMPSQYTRFTVETWVESAMRFFTNRNFRVVADDGRTLGYGRSVWAMIDTTTRQPTDILAIHDGDINSWIEPGLSCPIDRGGRVKMKPGEAERLRTIDTFYSDVDINGHVNSVKYIEHVLDLWPLDWHRQHPVRRFEIAYVAESHQGDSLTFWREQAGDLEWLVRISKPGPDGSDTEVVRSRVVFA